MRISVPAKTKNGLRTTSWVIIVDLVRKGNLPEARRDFLRNREFTRERALPMQDKIERWKKMREACKERPFVE